jgi:hypothetical protein
MRTPIALGPVPCLLPLLLAACTGLSAGPEVSAVTPLAASRDRILLVVAPPAQ